ncbi:hypothetical protein AWM75_06345 [Aerococcus urinaehominis]|uniref:lipoate--protein ligase n=1 Tax=Aerococcus urinaehominis TaxID=128944 RepID=A0A109RGP1_9LACT|nr:lipoate protein ligase C-terminal domain-containing protein [Aerococcus urinaehominis]AMB99625.1 hypothetical protein AWM75_06345 [Aerococcus urinaehominis]SDL87866.1 lipoate-protein ligase A [Aerococcus urinaehominis]
MRYVTYENDQKLITDPSWNIAFEEYMMSQADLGEDIFLSYINEPVVVLGRYQYWPFQVNADYLEENHVKLVRRFAAGGASYQDLGCLNFAYMAPGDHQQAWTTTDLLAPIMTALQHLGVDGVALRNRSNLLVDGQQFATTSSYHIQGRLVVHGTIMFDADLIRLRHALQPTMTQLTSPGLKSRPASVTNIQPYLGDDFQMIGIKQFRDALLKQIFSQRGKSQVESYKLQAADRQAIKNLQRSFTGQASWNQPEIKGLELHRFSNTLAGHIHFNFSIRHGKITKLRLYGDFIGSQSPDTLVADLQGAEYKPDALKVIFDRHPLAEIFGPVTSAELVRIMY